MKGRIMEKLQADVVIVGCGVSGLYCALNLPEDKNIIILSKDALDRSDSFLAQGGICVQHDDGDFESFLEDTLRAGHYENNRHTVEIMINSSREVISDLVSFGVKFDSDSNGFIYTKEGAHSKPRILFHKDETGKEITSVLLKAALNRKNITFMDFFTMVDIIEHNGECKGVVGHDINGKYSYILSDYTVFATGGIGGLYTHTTNFGHLTGDALAIAIEHGIRLKDISYIQIHPTTLYQEQKGRGFLISESVRGEGAKLLNDKGERFVDELLPRDVVTNAIYKEMNKTGALHVWLSLADVGEAKIRSHFPNIYRHCLDEGFDMTVENIPVVPSQHYFMGGIEVDVFSKTSMGRLYAVGETACNGVHGKNRLASNSLLESLVFAKRAARHMLDCYLPSDKNFDVDINPSKYENYEEKYRQAVLSAIEKERKKHE